MKNDHNVFISYRQREEIVDNVIDLVSRMSDEEINHWYDWYDLGAGEDAGEQVGRIVKKVTETYRMYGESKAANNDSSDV
jgi:hypothetical protein